MSVKDTPTEEKSVDERARDHEWFDSDLDDHVRQYLEGLDNNREGMYLVEVKTESVEIEVVSNRVEAESEAWSRLMERSTHSEGRPDDSKNVSYFEWSEAGIEDHLYGTRTHSTYVRLPETDSWVPALRALLHLADETYYIGRSSAGVAATVDDHLRGVSGRSMLRDVEPVRFAGAFESGIPEDEKSVGRDLTEGVFNEDGSLLPLDTIVTRGQLVFSPG
jgi:hypothetical protein